MSNTEVELLFLNKNFTSLSLEEIVALSIFVIFSGPVGSHAIAAAVHRGAAIHNREALEQGDANLTEASGIHSKEYIDSIMQQIDTNKLQEDNN